MNPLSNRQGRGPLLTEVAHQWLRQYIAAHRSAKAAEPDSTGTAGASPIAETTETAGAAGTAETAATAQAAFPAAAQQQRKMLAIDATAGNGHDTLFLANELGAGGQVAAFDIQLTALEQTAQRLRSAGIKSVQLAGAALPTTAAQESALPTTPQELALSTAPQESALPAAQQDAQQQTDEAVSVVLLHTSHANIAQAVPQSWRGNVCAITFNLGYLPGGDKEIVTHTASTLQALENALPLLSPDGLLSVLCYRGHGEGAQETAAIADWCKSTLPALGFSSRWIDAGNSAPASAPLLLHVFRAI